MILTRLITIGVDAANLRGGGGVTHLVELLRVAQPISQGIKRVIVWGGFDTLSLLDNHPWLDKRTSSALNGSLYRRVLWQRYCLSRLAREAGCDVLFVPGGSYMGNFHPVVTMSRNLLPFELRELLRYGLSTFTLKLLLLRLIQSRSFRRSDGLIFLTQYARQVILKITGELHGKSCTIPHGLNTRFKMKPKVQLPIDDFDKEHPCRLIYVSIVDHYKHQWHVIKAISTLRKKGLPIVLDLVGPFFPSALRRLNQSIYDCDPDKNWVHYHGAIAFDKLHSLYAQSDLGLFASSCENMPNILLETMASGLPIACSNRGPMPEVLGCTGVYFDPEQPEDIARVLHTLILSPQLRAELAQASYERAQQYSWERCARDTFGFIDQVARPRDLD